MAHLTLVLQGREVRKFVLNPTVTTIGRAQDNDIVINNLALSRRHAQVERKGGRFEVTDLGSQNGVYVNSEKVRGARALANEDTITLGTYHFVFNDTSDSEPDVRAVKRSSNAEVTGPAPLKSDPPREAREAVEDHVPLLVLKYNEVELQRFPLKKETSLVGRAKDCDVQIAERRLSRKHCEIHRKGDKFVVHDLGSQNGTYVNRKRIRDTHVLEDGDVLNFAEYSVLYLADVAKYDGPDLVHARRQAANARSAHVPGPRPGSDIEREETEFPEAYGEGYDESNAPSVVPMDEDHQVHPQELDENPDDSVERRPPMQMSPANGRAREPFIEDPKGAKERRKQQPTNRVIRDHAQTPPPRPRLPAKEEGPREGRRSMQQALVEVTPGPAVQVESREARDAREARESREAVRESRENREARDGREARDAREARDPARDPARDRDRKAAPPNKRVVRETVPQQPAAPRRGEMEDVPDELGDVRPDSSLEDWYKAREEKSEVFADEDSSVLLRGKSSVSKILSTMMVDKKELDRNLSVKAKQRKFFVDVRHGSEKIYSGPLMHPVTILGTDRDADIQLRGRYVAGRHSILVRVKDSLLLVRLGSSSAARVNGLPKLQAFLKTGDVIQIDETTIKILED